jgi:hypothetical protein
VLSKNCEKRLWASSRLNIRLSVPMTQRSPHWMHFVKFDISNFSIICWKNSSLIKTWLEKRLFYMKTYIHFWLYLSQFFSGWETFQTISVEKIRTDILCSIILLRKSCCLWDNVKYVRLRQTTDDTIIWRRKFARIRIQTRNIYYWIVCEKALNVTLYVHCLSYFPYHWINSYHTTTSLNCTFQYCLIKQIMQKGALIYQYLETVNLSLRGKNTHWIVGNKMLQRIYRTKRERTEGKHHWNYL